MVRFFVFEFNSKLEKTRVYDSFYNADSAYDLADMLNEDCRNHLSYYVGLCDTNNIQRDIDKKLIECCMRVGNCLSLAERCFLSKRKKLRFGCADFWFNQAYSICEESSKYID